MSDTSNTDDQGELLDEQIIPVQRENTRNPEDVPGVAGDEAEDDDA